MPRLPRIYVEKALYYVTSRGDYSQEIFKDREDYKMFLELLKKYKGQYGLKLFAFCLLPNHFHLLMELPKQGQAEDKAGILSAVMHDLNSSYTKYFNGRYQQKGHLFRERYKAALVEKEPYLLKVSAYIHLNPKALNLSVEPGAYPYSSYMFYLDKTLSQGDFLAEEKKELLGLLNGEDYGAFIEKISKEPVFTGLHNSLRKGILGTGDFEEKVRRMLSPSNEERKPRDFNIAIKPGVMGFVALFIGAGIVFALKIGLQEKGRASLPAVSSYKLPGQVKELLRDLEDMEWKISLIPPQGGRVRSGTVYFEEGRFFSRELSLENYLPAEYSLLIENDNKIVWESEQISGDASAYWKGEIKKGEMEGALRIKSPGAKEQDFSFVSVGSRKRR